MQNSGKEKDNKDQYKNTIYRIDRNSPVFLKSFRALPKKIREEVRRVEEQILLVDPYPRPWPYNRLITEIRYQYRDNYEIRVAEKYRYVYRVEGTIIYSKYVERRGNKTYAKNLNV